MYCPKCAAQVDGMKFCRQCGTNVSLLPQAMTGQLPAESPEWPMVGVVYPHGRRRRHRPATMETAGKEFFSGLGFLFLALAIWQFFPGGLTWWFWLLIPAFGAMGKGIGQYLSLRHQSVQLPVQPYNAPVAAPAPQPQLPVPTTNELKLPERAAATPPASITEHTTKHLDAARSRNE